MKSVTNLPLSDTQSIQLLPRWVTSSSGQAADSVAFSSGAALAMLDVVLRNTGGTLPGALLRDRLALKAAAACLKLEGRSEAEADIRDAICLTRAGDALGPAGEMFARWRAVAQINLTASGWRDRLARNLPDQVSQILPDFDLTRLTGAPVAQAAAILANVLGQFPRQEASALMLADLVLARALGWEAPVPLLAAHLTRRDIRAIADGDGDPMLYVHRAMIAACDGAIRSAADLSRRAAKLCAIAPKLRAKGAGEALSLFLSHDAVSPSGMLSQGMLPPTVKGTSIAMTDRAARRFCDRLVELGVVREMSGRPTFRLYGL